MRTLLLTFGLLLATAASAATPEGWFMAGSHPEDYAMNLDETQAYSGSSSAVLAHGDDNPRGFGTMMQMFEPTDYLGKRVRLTAMVKSEDVERWAGVWFRVDGPRGESIAFDNMQDRPIEGTSDWHEVEVVLDVGPTAENIAFGLLLVGRGTVWIDDLSFEVVSESVPLTGRSRAMTQKKPVNLSFED